ncbi:mitochondral 37S ribosomal protein S27 [Entomophthora muscae]|uniref:Mitochondral 37S ribosomal protein S27 n=1 Tax=Entomophthora muscae TaxID=34485 RepID=A0ACC2U563_9FUNG|nr:mitochondral 37S ribosomal protein S27 [Entomophthora muscae]
MSTLVSATRKLALQQVIAKVFGHVEPVLKPIRTGRKFIKPLQGPELTSYYPEPFSIKKFCNELNRNSEGIDLGMDGVTEEERYRLEILASRKSRGKGPPKKGMGRRQALKKK